MRQRWAAALAAVALAMCASAAAHGDDVRVVRAWFDDARAIDAVNTIVNENGVLHAYNTDYQAVANLLGASGFSTDYSVAVTGSEALTRT